jgi:hypothetical protein
LAALISQLATRSQPCLSRLQTFYNQQTRLRQPDENVLLDCLLDVLRAATRTFIVLDALDECADSTRNDDLLPFIQMLAKGKPDALHLLMTSRPTPDIRNRILPLSTRALDLYEVKERENDVAQYIFQEISDSSVYNWPPHVKARVELVLRSKAEGM